MITSRAEPRPRRAAAGSAWAPWRRFRSPATRPPGSAPEPAPGSTPAARTRKWILVVDDDPGVRRLLTTVLEATGYVVVAARDGLEATDLARQLRPHLVILDLRMPGMSGGELLRSLGQTPIIVLSGYVGDLTAEQAARRNIVDRLTKPVDVGMLRARVADALRGFHP